MSHFTVAVFTEPNGKNIEQLLAPFHEFECTGVVDEYVQSIDITSDVRKEYSDSTLSRIKSPDGKLYFPWDDAFYRDPTEEEKKQLGSVPGSGCGNGLSWTSKDWDDGLGYRVKVRFIPEGYEQLELNTPDIMPFCEYIKENYCYKPVSENENPDIQDEHKYGWFRVSENGEVVEVIKRTNPDPKWDYWGVGGRWSGMLVLKSGGKGEKGSPGLLTPPAKVDEYDSALVSDIDFDAMEQRTKANLVPFSECFERKLYKEEYFKELYPTEESYIKEKTQFSTYAVVTPDGVWHASGEMGWFGISSEKRDFQGGYFERFIKPAIENGWRMTVVDCHI